MKVSYDKKHDIAYIRLSSKKPDGAIEIAEGVVLDTTARNEIVGIEIFDASPSREGLPAAQPVFPGASAGVGDARAYYNWGRGATGRARQNRLALASSSPARE